MSGSSRKVSSVALSAGAAGHAYICEGRRAPRFGVQPRVAVGAAPVSAARRSGALLRRGAASPRSIQTTHLASPWYSFRNCSGLTLSEVHTRSLIQSARRSFAAGALAATSASSAMPLLQGRSASQRASDDLGINNSIRPLTRQSKCYLLLKTAQAVLKKAAAPTQVEFSTLHLSTICGADSGANKAW